MVRFVVRFVGLWLLAAALVTAVVDGAKSIAASRVVLTSIADVSAAAGFQPAVAGGDWGMTWLPTADELLRLTPVTAVFAAAGILLLVAGRRRRVTTLSRQFAA